MDGYAAENSAQVHLVGHFGLSENPFGVTPDPRFLFLSQTHQEALATLIIGIDCGFGFQALVAQPGMGKTTLLFNLLERLRTTAHTAFLFQPQLNPYQLLQTMLFELEASSEETSLYKLSEQLNQVLCRAARARKRVIVVVDEAQGLDSAVLETLRQLSNFETPHSKLMQIIMAGQPQLVENLASPQQEQLRQRISAIGRLSPLALSETRAYINHRLRTAGYLGVDLFTQGAVRHVWIHSRGVPRNINTLCFNAMLLALAKRANSIDENILEEAARDLDLKSVLADLYEMEPQPIAVSASNGKVQPNREPEPPNIDNARPGAIEKPVAARLSMAGATIPVDYSGDRNPGCATENIPTALSEAISSISQAPEKQKVLLAAESIPVEGLPPDTLMTTTTLSSPGKASTPQLQPANAGAEPSNLLEAPVMHSFQSIAKERPEHGSLRAKALSLATLTGILGFFLIREFQVHQGLFKKPRRLGVSASKRSDSAMNAPIGLRESTPVGSRSSRNANSDTFEQATVQNFPPRSSVAPEASGKNQKLKSIFFDQDSDMIGWRYRAFLRQIADALAENPKAGAILEGHTDNSGPESYNLDLSRRRAIAVRNALVNELHVSSTRVKPTWVGSAAPVQPNSTAAGRAYNRRVEVRWMHPSDALPRSRSRAGARPSTASGVGNAPTLGKLQTSKSEDNFR